MCEPSESHKRIQTTEGGETGLSRQPGRAGRQRATALPLEKGVCLLFLLKDDQGRALLLVQADNQTEADCFGRSHLPEFCGDTTEIEVESRVAAEEFWRVRTVHLMHMGSSVSGQARKTPAHTFKHTWVLGPELPEEVEEDGLLTPEDRAAITVDHMTRTSHVVGSFRFRLHSFVR